jgi:hypothetical protein
VNCVAGGAQKTRSVDVIPTEDGVIVPTDTPRERNWIQRLDTDNGRINRIAPLPNSAFHAQRFSDDLFVITTVPEPSPCNDTDKAYVFASRDGERWVMLSKLRRDIPNLSLLNRWTRYPEVVLTPVRGEARVVCAYGRAIERCDGRLIWWNIDDVRRATEEYPSL